MKKNQDGEVGMTGNELMALIPRSTEMPILGTLASSPSFNDNPQGYWVLRGRNSSIGTFGEVGLEEWTRVQVEINKGDCWKILVPPLLPPRS